MAVNYTINNVIPIGSDLLKIIYQYTLFDTPIVETLYIPVEISDTIVKSMISAKINSAPITPTASLASPDDSAVSLRVMEGQTYATT